MNKEQCLKILEEGLKKLPHEEREEILQDFQEHFAIGLEQGKTEEEIAASLGSPQQIAKEMVATSHIEHVSENRSIGNIIRATWAVIGLSFFNLVIVLGPFLALVGILLAGWLTGISFVASPFIFLFNVLFFHGTFITLEFFLSITLCGVGLLALIGMYYATVALSNLFVRYLKYNVNLVKGGLKNES